MSEIFSSISQLFLKGNILFGSGWVFHARENIKTVGYRIHFAEQEESSGELYEADSGKRREDVAKDFPDHLPRSLNSGYVILCGLPAGGQVRALSLEIQLSCGVVINVPIELSRLRRVGEGSGINAKIQMLLQFGVLFSRGLNLIRVGQFSTLLEKVRRYLKGRPMYSSKSACWIAQKLEAYERGKVSLIIDHDLGGGANHYREQMVASKISAGGTVIIFSYHVVTLSCMLIVRSGRLNFRTAISDRNILFELVEHLTFEEILYNTAVSFPRPEEIPQLLISLKQMTAARLKVYAHDHLPICPSHVLLDHMGKYCNIPDVSICRECLSRNRQGFASLFVERDIEKWRVIWGQMLAAADEIVTFSNSTARLFKKAYPQIQDHQLSVVPHVVEHLDGQIPVIKQKSKLSIGVVGQVGFHKGAGFVQALAQEIKQRGVDVKISVIGAIEVSCEPSVVSQTGPYRYDELPGLIEASGANVMLFPSICPETFSYVVQELMDMQLPVASFNLGAPAERLTGYSKGLVLDVMDPAGVLEELIAFHRKLYLAH